jgi:hypothetical protein
MIIPVNLLLEPSKSIDIAPQLELATSLYLVGDTRVYKN